MNPDYYKTNYRMMYKHEKNRVKEMDDNQLETRYGKMTKKDKIGAFYEALVDKDRHPKLRKRMEGNHGIKATRPEMKFIKVLNNDDDGDGNTDKKALFFFEDNYYLYSFVCNNLQDGACTVNETMTFLSNEAGEIVDAHEIYSANGYIHSTDAMNNTVSEMSV